MEDVIRYRLRMSEVIPMEMNRYRIGTVPVAMNLSVKFTSVFPGDGRVFFTAPRLFTTSLCLKGALPDDGWFFVDVEFLFNVGGDPTGMEGMFSLLFC